MMIPHTLTAASRTRSLSPGKASAIAFSISGYSSRSTRDHMTGDGRPDSGPIEIRLLDNDTALILFDPHRDLFPGLEREAVISCNVRGNGNIPGPRPIGELNDPTFSFL